MADVMASYESMNSTASKVESAAGELEALISNLSSVVSALGEGYQGAGYSAFVSAWEEAKPKMEVLKNRVQGFAPTLRSAANRLQETEAANSSAFG